MLTKILLALIGSCYLGLIIWKPFYGLLTFIGISILFSEFTFDSNGQTVDSLYNANLGPVNAIEYIIFCTLFSSFLYKLQQKLNNYKFRNYPFTKASDNLGLLISIWFIIVSFSVFISFLSKNTIDSVYEIRRVLPFFITYYITIALINNKTKIYNLISITILFGGIKGLEGLFNFLSGKGVPISGGLISVFPGWKESLVFLSLICMTIGIWIYHSDYKSKKKFLLLSLLMGFSFIVSYRRTLWITILLSIIIINIPAWFNSNLSLKIDTKKMLLLIISIVVSIIILPMVFETINQNSIKLPNIIGVILDPQQDSSVSYRLWESANAWSNITDSLVNFIFGIGLGTEFEIKLPLSAIKKIPTNLYIHNTYVWIWLKMGIIGLINYCLILVEALRLSWSLFKNTRVYIYQALTISLFGIVISIILAGITAPFFSEMSCSIWFGYLLGILSIINKLNIPQH